MGVWATLNVYWAMYARDGTTASKWAQMPVVEKAFEGARLNPTKTTYVRTCVFCVPPFQHHSQKKTRILDF